MQLWVVQWDPLFRHLTTTAIRPSGSRISFCAWRGEEVIEISGRTGGYRCGSLGCRTIFFRRILEGPYESMLRGQQKYIAVRSYCKQVMLVKEHAEREKMRGQHPSRVPSRRGGFGLPRGLTRRPRQRGVRRSGPS